MSGLCGYFVPPGGAPPDQKREKQALAALSTPGERQATLALPGAWLAASARLSPAVCRVDDVVAALWGSPAVVGSKVEEWDPAAYVGRAYASGQLEFLGNLRGSFCLAAYDVRRSRGLIALDRMGRGSLTYGLVEGNLCFATHARALRCLASSPLQIEPQAIVDYLYFHMLPGPGTFFRELRRLEPGEYLLFEAGRTTRGRYWTAVFDEQAPARFSEAKERFIALLQNSVRRAAGTDSVACFLSGGTDSSTIAGMIGRVSGAPARTYSIGFAAPGYDEMAYARIAARHFGTRHCEYYVTPDDVVAAVPVIARSYDQPFGNASAVPTYYCARLARSHGVEVLLAGDGGDELFGGNQRYADQYLLSLYSRLPAAVRRGVLEPMSALPGARRVLPLRKIGSYIAQASLPMPERLQAYNAFSRFGSSSMLDPGFRAAVDCARPQVLERAVYHAVSARSLINRMLALDWKFTLADNDLRKVGGMCEVAGVDVRYPLLDEELVDFSLHLPPHYKVKGTRLRWFFKKALRHFLPPPIIHKKKHGFGLPFGLWVREHSQLGQLAYDSLSDLRSRGIVASSFIDRMIAGHRNEHAAYYGAQIWVLMMLEQWFQHHVDAGERALLDLPPGIDAGRAAMA